MLAAKADGKKTEALCDVQREIREVEAMENISGVVVATSTSVKDTPLSGQQSNNFNVMRG